MGIIRAFNYGLAVLVLATGLSGCASNNPNSNFGSFVTREPASKVWEYTNIEKPINGIGTVVDSKPGRTIARYTSAQGLSESLEYKPEPSPEPTFDEFRRTQNYID